ncbi:MAG: alpha/beta hydrolase [Clostridia bacterium]|nr:alpha/beta hydrolase [Clostridia bacterium]
MLRAIMHVGVGVLNRMMARNDAKIEKQKTLPRGVVEFANIPYDETSGKFGLLDVYAPSSGRTDLPVIIDVHGGGFFYGNKELNKRFCYALVLRGFVVVSVNYRLVPKVTFDKQVCDVVKAMQWVERNARKYGGDPNRLSLSGDSAGACLALMACAVTYSEKVRASFGAEKVLTRPRSLFFQSGMFDLRKKGTGLRLAKYAYGRGFMYKKAEWYKYTDLGALLVGCKLPPVFLSSSEGDFIGAHTLEFAERLEKAGARYQLDYRKKEKREDGHEYFHVYLVKHPEWRECAVMLNDVAKFLTTV